MIHHAPSQLSTEEATRRMLAALASPEHRASLRLERAVAVGRQAILERSRIDTPAGPLHRVAEVQVLTREPTWECCYYDEADAIEVWEHFAETARNPEPTRGPRSPAG